MKINSRLKLALAIIPLGLIIAAVPENKTKPYKLTASQMLEKVQNGQQFLHPDQVAAMVVDKDPSLQLIDIRSKDEYDNYHLPQAINIPLSDLLNPDFEAYLNQGVKLNVFYSNGVTRANEAWMIVAQMGYKNNYVLQGGLNFWAETILSPEKPKTTSPDDEFARYDFRKAASGSLGGGSLEVKQESAPPANLPPVMPQKAKKRVAGGC